MNKQINKKSPSSAGWFLAISLICGCGISPVLFYVLVALFMVLGVMEAEVFSYFWIWFGSSFIISSIVAVVCSIINMIKDGKYLKRCLLIVGSSFIISFIGIMLVFLFGWL